MSIIAQIDAEKIELYYTVQRFFSEHKIGTLLRKCNASKEKGVPVISIFRYKLCNVFMDRSMYMQQATGAYHEDFSRNTFYRFLNSARTNWLRFTSLLAADIVNSTIKDLTDEKRTNVFIVDDTLFNRTGCKRTELASRVFDHTDMRYRKGYRLMTLGWSDGNTFIPVNSCLLASSNSSNVIGLQKPYDKRSGAGRRRKLAQQKGTDAMMALIDVAKSSGLSADYVVFDCWFANPAQITATKDRGMIPLQ